MRNRYYYSQTETTYHLTSDGVRAYFHLIFDKEIIFNIDIEYNKETKAIKLHRASIDTGKHYSEFSSKALKDTETFLRKTTNNFYTSKSLLIEKVKHQLLISHYRTLIIEDNIKECTYEIMKTF